MVPEMSFDARSPANLVRLGAEDASKGKIVDGFAGSSLEMPYKVGYVLRAAELRSLQVLGDGSYQAILSALCDELAISNADIQKYEPFYDAL